VRGVWVLIEVEVEVEVGLMSLWGGVVEFFTAAGKEKVREEIEIEMAAENLAPPSKSVKVRYSLSFGDFQHRLYGKVR
jgi:hypothetical protein